MLVWEAQVASLRHHIVVPWLPHVYLVFEDAATELAHLARID